MATQIKKVVFGPLTVNATEPAGVEFVGPAGSIVKVLLSELSPEMRDRLAVHGLAQKIGDSYAGASEEPDPLASSIAWIGETATQVRANDWRVSSVGGGGPRASLLAKALARATGNSLEDSIAVIDLLGDEDLDGQPGKKSLRKALKGIIATITAEEATARAAKVGTAPDATSVAKYAALYGPGLKSA
jgi:hypothetical protein